LKQEGFTDKQIAKKLKQMFPEINPSRVGRLITAKENVTVTTEAYRGRGRKLLK
jgi:hypothetical protein